MLNPVFVKLGGSLITDKKRPQTPRPDVMGSLAAEVWQILDAAPDLALLLSHGSGSFGHWVGRRYGTRAGVRGREGWIGYAQVAAAAARLNRLVSDAFLKAGVPVLSLQPSASARCRDGRLVSLDVEPIRRALDERLVPLVYGDVAFDAIRGGTIISTEEILGYLAGILRPRRILLLGETDGVYGPEGSVVPLITPQNIRAMEESLGRSEGVDVTGGMLGKVQQMLNLVQEQPGLEVHIFSGVEPGLLSRALLDPERAPGTRLRVA